MSYILIKKIVATIKIKKQFFWHGIKKNVVEFIARCMEFQRVKVEHRHPVGFLQSLPIPEKKWEVVTIDFITKFPRTTRKHDSIMVVVDKLTKVAHFSQIKTNYTTTNIVEIYMKEIGRASCRERV